MTAAKTDKYSNNPHKEVKDLIVMEADMHSNDLHADEALPEIHKAVLDDNPTKLSELLLQNNSSVNQVTDDGKIPLHLAAYHGHTEIVEILIKNGADVNKKDYDKPDEFKPGLLNFIVYLFSPTPPYIAKKFVADGRTALHIAAYQGHTKIVEILIKNGAFINASDDDGITPLHLASLNGHTEIVEMLLKHNADAEKVNIERESALHIAANLGYTEIVDILLEHNVYAEKGNIEGDGALHLASLNGHTEIVKKLLEYNPCNLTTLISTFHDLFPYSLKRLLGCKVNVNGAANDYTRALHLAAAQGHTEIVETLIKNGAYIDHINIDWLTPLHIASMENRAEVVKILLENNVHINKHSLRQGSALHIAAYHGHTEIAEILIKNGADINKLDDHGRTPFYIAQSRQHYKTAAIIVKEMLAKNSDMSQSQGILSVGLLFASIYGLTGLARILLENGADANQKIFGLTALHAASMSGYTDIVKILLENGADVNNETGEWTALLSAYMHGYTDTVRILLENGADIYKKNNEGKTALDLAKEKGHPDIESLISQHAEDKEISENVVDTYSETPDKAIYIEIEESGNIPLHADEL